MRILRLSSFAPAASTPHPLEVSVFRDAVFGFRVSGFGIRISGSGFQVSGSEFPVQVRRSYHVMKLLRGRGAEGKAVSIPNPAAGSVGIRDSGFEIRDSGFRIKDSGIPHKRLRGVS